jgi:hypothetical protein
MMSPAARCARSARWPIGENIRATAGSFNLSSPGGSSEERLIEYRLTLEPPGRTLFLMGTKHVRDDPGFDVWSDTTTLATTLHGGIDETPPVPGAGVLGIGPTALVDPVRSMRSTSGSARAVARLGSIFLGELWERYA